jgi:hypothetical protein
MTMLERISEWMMQRANETRLISPEFSRGLAWYAEQLPFLEDPLPTQGICLECGGVSVVHARLCKGSADYKAGCRATWVCTNPDCNEMEVR